jgi:hypothetical protein
MGIFTVSLGTHRPCPAPNARAIHAMSSLVVLEEFKSLHDFRSVDCFNDPNVFRLLLSSHVLDISIALEPAITNARGK